MSDGVGDGVDVLEELDAVTATLAAVDAALGWPDAAFPTRSAKVRALDGAVRAFMAAAGEAMDVTDREMAG